MGGNMGNNALRTGRWLLPAACLIGLAACATTPEEDPVLQGKLSDLDSRTGNIERVVQNQSLLTLAQRADQLQNEVSVLRGRIEVLENANDTLRKQQRDLYADLDKRLSSSQVSAQAPGVPAAGQPAGASPDLAAYNQAFDILKAGKYADAITAFAQFLQSWPQSSLADNAQYWLGESYYVTRDFQNASAAFQTVLDRWPDSRKAPDALLKLGYTQAELHRTAQARATLTSVSTRYPGSEAANLAGRAVTAITGTVTLRLKLTEIFRSLQGEADTAGIPTVFVRLTGCPLRCQYCDTAYAFHGGEWATLEEVIHSVRAFDTHHVCVTGGEPLAQKGCAVLLTRLCDEGLRVSLETSGAMPLTGIDARVVLVVDVKTPGSGEESRNRYLELRHLTSKDLVKFVICSREDYEWSRAKLDELQLAARCTVLFSPSHEQLQPGTLADWLLEDHLPVRFQVQLHKYLWGNVAGK